MDNVDLTRPHENDASSSARRSAASAWIRTVFAALIRSTRSFNFFADALLPAAR